MLSSPSNTRLVTIVAHVDHGKTTLADSLVEHNGIISERLAGTMRYLDSMEEEQRRGITIRSSTIGLKHSYKPLRSSEKRDMVIHFVDSPGHVDFSMEVSSALQICDGALLLVDVVEGMCTRTHAILREIASQKLVPILVLNKIDRLFTDLELSVNEAYLRIRSLIESVNAAASAILQRKMAEQKRVNSTEEPFGNNETTGSAYEYHRSGSEISYYNHIVDESTSHEELAEMEKIWTFSPGEGNIVFTSAVYGWGFTIPSLARSLFKSKVIPDIKPPVLRQYLFGDFKYNTSTHRITKMRQKDFDEGICSTLFAEYGLKPLQDMINCTSSIEDGNHKMNIAMAQLSSKILSSMRIGAVLPLNSPKDLLPPKTPDEIQQIMKKTSASSVDAILRCLLRRHRPLSEAILDAVCNHCPSPSESSSTIRKNLLKLVDPDDDEEHNDDTRNYSYDKDKFSIIQKAVKSCDVQPNSPTVAHVCKFILTDRSFINDPELFSILDAERKNNDIESNESNIILGVARVLSGNLRAKDIEYNCFGPKHKFRYRKKDFDDLVSTRKIRVYLLMGSSFVAVSSIPAGHFCAIYGLDDLELKTVTLCDSRYGMQLVSCLRGLQPLVKVNIETVCAADRDILEEGLAKLSLADGAAEISVTSSGALSIACLGEIHLEQAILDLHKMFSKKIEFRLSEPIVEFGESTDWFENETEFAQFYDNKSIPLRQTLIPPYCYEDGLEHAKRGRSRAILAGRSVAISLRVVPLANIVYNCLRLRSVIEGSEEKIISIGKVLNCSQGTNTKLEANDVLEQLLRSLIAIDEKGNAMVQTAGVVSGECVKGVVTRSSGQVYVPTIAPNETDDQDLPSQVSKEEYNLLKECIRKGGLVSEKDGNIIDNPTLSEVDYAARRIWNNEISPSTVAGFQSGCAAGPLCEEHIRNVLVIIEGVEIALIENANATDSISISESTQYSCPKVVNGGMVVASMRTAIRCSLLTRPVRLVESHFRLTLHSSLSGLGPLYAILSKRRGRVMSDTMVDGTDLISISAILPQVESFSLAPELLDKSSGEVTAPELIFSHWEVLNEDPFWIPTSLEEREDYGEIIMNGDMSTGVGNNALKYIRMVRDRKGLMVDSNKLIYAAEKQRTLARKK